jgi:hypothetical protein
MMEVRNLRTERRLGDMGKAMAQARACGKGPGLQTCAAQFKLA